MNVNRRKFLQSAAAVSVGASGFATRAFSEEPIGVAGIHDLSGGLDIYGKPMVDALTLAVEAAREGGGIIAQVRALESDERDGLAATLARFGRTLTRKD